MGKTKKVLKAVAVGAAVAGLAYATADVFRERKAEKAKFHEVRRGVQDIRYQSDKTNWAPKGSRKFNRQVDQHIAAMLAAADVPTDFYM